MTGKKSLSQVAKALRAVMFTEENQGINHCLLAQVGSAKLMRALAKTVKNVGLGKNIIDLYRFRMGGATAHFFLSLWEVLGKREAIVDGDRRLTFAQMRNRVIRLANGLKSLDIKPKDRIAALLYNGAEYFELFYTASIMGTPLPAVNWHLDIREIVKIVNLRNPKILVFDADFLDDIMMNRSEMPNVEHFIITGKSAPADFISYEQLIADADDSIPEDVTFLFAMNPYTGGTTGSPKSSNLYDGLSYLLSDVAEAPRTSMKEYVSYLTRQFSFLYYCGGDLISDPKGKNIRSLIPTPMYHAGTAAGYSPCVLMGATAVTMKQFDPENFLAMIQKERISWSFVVPTILQRICALPDEITKKYDLTSMHSLLCAAAPCPPEVKTDINRLFIRQGAPRPVFHEYYGSSESAVLTLLIPDDYMANPERIKSVGKPRCGDILIYDEIIKRPVETGKDGIVLGRSVATLSLTYPGSEKKLKDSQRIVDGKEWYDDALIGHQDKDGFLYLTGRIKEMIICGGVNVFPIEIERVLFLHPDIEDCAVIKAPDPDLGEIPLACVKLKDGASATEDEIRIFCKENGLAGYNVPKKVNFLSKLPRHIDGKIIKRKLEEPLWEGLEKRG
ncbi:MAG: AMP-binding protein [Deltaproteobacteria bacterium]|nr:AMP-binding protein [Deltaproteobacteria bacterium]